MACISEHATTKCQYLPPASAPHPTLDANALPAGTAQLVNCPTGQLPQLQGRRRAKGRDATAVGCCFGWLLRAPCRPAPSAGGSCPPSWRWQCLHHGMAPRKRQGNVNSSPSTAFWCSLPAACSGARSIGRAAVHTHDAGARVAVQLLHAAHMHTAPDTHRPPSPVSPPVKLMQLTAGCMVRKSPISLPLPVTRLMRPGGKPALWNACIMCTPATQPCVGGLSTTALPAMSAGASLLTARLTG
jgi:hypothetical protein